MSCNLFAAIFSFKHLPAILVRNPNYVTGDVTGKRDNAGKRNHHLHNCHIASHFSKFYTDNAF